MGIYRIGLSGFDVSKRAAQSGTVLALCAIGLWVLFELARPLDRIRLTLVVTMAGAALGAFTIPAAKRYFLLELPPADYLAVIGAVVAASALAINVALRLVSRYLAVHPARYPAHRP